MDSSETRGDDVAFAPVIYTSDLAQRVFKEFGLDGDAIAPFVAALVVPARAKSANGAERRF